MFSQIDAQIGPDLVRHFAYFDRGREVQVAQYLAVCGIHSFIQFSKVQLKHSGPAQQKKDARGHTLQFLLRQSTKRLLNCILIRDIGKEE